MDAGKKKEVYDFIEAYLINNHGIDMSHIIQTKFGKQSDVTVYYNMKAMLEENGKYLVNETNWYVTNNPAYKQKWLDEENAFQKWMDYPKIKRERNISIYIAIGMFLIALATLLWKSKCD